MAFVNIQPNPWILGTGVALDLLLGDPEYGGHPVRLIGWTLMHFEASLRRIGLNGYAGGILLFLLLNGLWTGAISAAVISLPNTAAMVVHIYFVYSLLALRDLLRHAWDVERSAKQGNLPGTRAAIAKLVGRDTSRMDLAACRRAAIESLSENLTDGFISPIFWYTIAGLPGLVAFKVVSTMDSMVGYRTPRYLRFGWCGARTDDLLNWIPARLTWLLLCTAAMFLPGYSARKSLFVGWRQHAIVPGPNSGWSEAATAGAIERKLVGPIWANGKLVTEIWLGDPSDTPAGDDSDLRRAAILIVATGLFASFIAMGVLIAFLRLR